MSKGGIAVNNNTISSTIEKKDLLDLIYPIGSIYTSMNATSPATLFGGEWTQIVDEFLYCANSSNLTGGANSVSYTPAGYITMNGHYHGLGAGYALIKTNAGSNTGGYLAKSVAAYGVDRIFPTNGHAYTGYDSMTEGVSLGGTTDYATSSGVFTGYAATISTIPKYRTVYAWYRTA